MISYSLALCFALSMPPQFSDEGSAVMIGDISHAALLVLRQSDCTARIYVSDGTMHRDARQIVVRFRVDNGPVEMRRAVTHRGGRPVAIMWDATGFLPQLKRGRRLHFHIIGLSKRSVSLRGSAKALTKLMKGCN